MTNPHAHEGHETHSGDLAVVMDEVFWNERYESSDSLWSGDPNPQLVREVSGLAPGIALDVGCGEGADAIWLAQQDWEVTAVDISTIAIQRAQSHALKVGPALARHITWIHADLTDYILQPGSFDLVSAQFLHLPTGERQVLHQRLAASVAPGGTMLIVSHDPSDLRMNIRRPRASELFATASEVAAALPAEEWVVLVAEARPRLAVDADGQEITIHDAVMRAQRRG